MTDETPGIDLGPFAEAVGPPEAGPVAVRGTGTRRGTAPGCRTVVAPAGIAWFQPDEMTVCCGAGTPTDELHARLADAGQRVNLPAGGTVGGALAAGRSTPQRLGLGPMRDVLLQARYVAASGEVITAGGPTVKNVTGFDLCRVLVGSWGTLGFLGEVILRTRPRPAATAWFTTRVDDPTELLGAAYRPASVLWDGTTSWVCLEGHPGDIAEAAARCRWDAAEGPPPLPTGGRWSMPPGRLHELSGTGRFVAEVGVGVVHHERAPTPTPVPEAVAALHRSVKQQLDPWGRLNPGIDVLDAGAG